MPINPPMQMHGVAPAQHGFQVQGQAANAPQGSPNTFQQPMGHSKTPSSASQISMTQQGVTAQQAHAPVGYQTPQPAQNMMPAPLFNSGGNRPTQQQAPVANGPPPNTKWSQGPAADYSGGDWGDEENWERR
jgi:hypothetical protein